MGGEYEEYFGEVAWSSRMMKLEGVSLGGVGYNMLRDCTWH